jgi:ribonuclease-3
MSGSSILATHCSDLSLLKRFTKNVQIGGSQRFDSNNIKNYLKYNKKRKGEPKSFTLKKKIDLGQYIKLGSGELKSGGWRRNSILANTFEAIIGALYLDSNFDSCRTKVLALYEPLLKNISPEKLNKDPKTRLQEYLQAHKHSLPDYKIITEEGEAHAKIFFISCEISELGVDVQAEGRSKRAAEQAAAQEVLDILEI